MNINWGTVATTVVGALIAAAVIYQVKERTKGIVDAN